MLSLVPEWLIKMLISYAVQWGCKKLGLDAVAVHIETVMAKVTPLAPEVNPPPMQSNDPNQAHDAAHGGWES